MCEMWKELGSAAVDSCLLAFVQTAAIASSSFPGPTAVLATGWSYCSHQRSSGRHCSTEAGPWQVGKDPGSARRPTWASGLGFASYRFKPKTKSFTSLRLSFLICKVGKIHNNFTSRYINSVRTQWNNSSLPSILYIILLFLWNKRGKICEPAQPHRTAVFSCPPPRCPSSPSGKRSIALSCSRATARQNLIICGYKLATTLDELISSYRKWPRASWKVTTIFKCLDIFF